MPRFRIMYTLLYFFLLQASADANETASEKINEALKQANEFARTKPDSAIILLKWCNSESFRNKNWSAQAQANKLLGMIMSERGQFTDAALYASTALSLFHRIKDQGGIADCKNLQGNIFMLQGQSEPALQNFLECIKMCEKESRSRLLLICYSNVSLLYNRLRQFDLSLYYARKQYRLAVALNNPDEIGYGCSPIIDVFSHMDKVDSMEKYVSLFRDAVQNTKDPYLPAILANVTGAMYDRKKDLSRAIPWFQKAVKLNTELNDEDAVCQSLNNLGAAYFQNKQYKEAKETLLNALKSSQAASNVDQQKEACLTLSYTFEKLLDYKQAYHYRVLYQQFSDSVLNENSQRTIRQLEAKYEFDKKNSAIQLLSKENTLQASVVEQRQAERNLVLISSLAILGFGLFFGNRYVLRKKLANEKAIQGDRLRISQDLHDDVGSSLSSIQIYSRVVGKLMEEDPEKARKMLEQIGENSQTSINNLGDIVWAMKTDIDENPMETRIKNFCIDLLDPKGIEVEYVFETPLKQIFQTAEQRKNALLLVKEAIHNMAKYSGASHVKIGFAASKGVFELKIEDDGVGFNPETVRRGNGMETMKKRAETLGGILSVESQTGKGTRIKFIAYT